MFFSKQVHMAIPDLRIEKSIENVHQKIDKYINQRDTSVKPMMAGKSRKPIRIDNIFSHAGQSKIVFGEESLLPGVPLWKVQ